jgi:hypothetical protein
MTLIEALNWLLNSGGGAVVASFILELIPWYQAQTPAAKKYIFFGVSAVVTVGAYLVLTFVPKEILDAIAPYFALLYGVAASALFGTAYHKATKLDK